VRARAGLLVAGLALGWVAYALHAAAPPERLALLTAWSERFPDARPTSPAEAARHDRERAEAVRRDAVWLLAGLAAGCLAVAAAGGRLRAAGGGGVGAVLVASSVGVGAAGVVVSLKGQWSRAARDAWTLADDNLRAVAGPFADTLRTWREQVGPRDALVVVGGHDVLLNAVAWAMHPRPIHPLGVSVPPSMSVDEARDAVARSDLGADAPARWLVDLDALAQRDAATRPPLVRIDP